MDINAKINKRNAERLLDELMDECKRIGYEHAEDELKSLRAEVETLRRERIKGLEAERDAERDNCVAVIATYQAELAALRQRIDDAPVVAWLHTQSNGCSSLIRTPPSAFDPQDLADAEVSIYALISKEDLK